VVVGRVVVVRHVRIRDVHRPLCAAFLGVPLSGIVLHHRFTPCPHASPIHLDSGPRHHCTLVLWHKLTLAGLCLSSSGRALVVLILVSLITISTTTVGMIVAAPSCASSQPPCLWLPHIGGPIILLSTAIHNSTPPPPPSPPPCPASVNISVRAWQFCWKWELLRCLEGQSMQRASTDHE
jgi:hypothetical protein